MRILLMGDHQIKSRSGYEWLMKAAQRKIEEKYGDLTENINMIMNIGDQVDVGTLDQYEQIHLFKSITRCSPYLPRYQQWHGKLLRLPSRPYPFRCFVH